MLHRMLFAGIALVLIIPVVAAHPPRFRDSLNGPRHGQPPLIFSPGGLYGFYGFGPVYDCPPFGYSGTSINIIQYSPPPPIFYQPIYLGASRSQTGVWERGDAPQPVLYPIPERPNGAPRLPAPAPKLPAAKPKDELERQAEGERLIRQGNDAFAEGNYAQAARRYEQALAMSPLDAMAYFHLGQAHVAQGKYAEASLAIRRGLRLHPGWPKTAFQPRALYRDRPGELEHHLKQLADLLAKNLNDQSLLFLLGYQLWFDGKQNEAVVLFRRAAALAQDSTHIDAFLKVEQPAAVPVAGK